MCVVSIVIDHYRDKWTPTFTPQEPQQQPWYWATTFPNAAVSRAEFDALKRDVEELKLLVKRAKEYDERNGEPDCEMDEKVELVRKVAELVGVDIEDLF